MSGTTGLLVSVRSVDEVEAALTGGADLIDVKEPAKGPLAPAEAEVVAAVIAKVKGRTPVSAALGEWSPNAITDAHWHLELKLNYVKWGLAGYTHSPGWGEDLLDTRRELPVGMEMVAVAYADWERAKSVPPAELVRFAKRFRFKAFLLDTWGKDGKTLLDFVTPAEVARAGGEPEASRDHGGHRRFAAARARQATEGRDAGLLRGAILGVRGGQARRRHRCGSRQEVEGRDQLNRFRHSNRFKGAKGARFYAFGTGTLAGQKLTITVANS